MTPGGQSARPVVEPPAAAVAPATSGNGSYLAFLCFQVSKPSWNCQHFHSNVSLKSLAGYFSSPASEAAIWSLQSGFSKEFAGMMAKMDMVYFFPRISLFPNQFPPRPSPGCLAFRAQEIPMVSSLNCVFSLVFSTFHERASPRLH